MTRLGHHTCHGCETMVGFEFYHVGDDITVAFNRTCDCGDGASPAEPRTWEQFAEIFNLPMPEVRAEMWARFKVGNPTHQFDQFSNPLLSIHVGKWELLSKVVSDNNMRIEWTWKAKSAFDGHWIKKVTQQMNLDGSILFQETSTYEPD